MKLNELGIGFVSLFGVIISALLVLYGGVLYLIANGHNSWSAEILPQQAIHFSFSHARAQFQNHDPLAFVLLGIIVLFITQLLRVALAALIFLLRKEYIIFVFSCFVFCILFASLAINL